jgi:heme/copper-type cytochrome/quinol oxidase subunit 2
LFAFLHEMGEQRTPHAAATQKPASDEEPQHAAISAFPFAFLVIPFVLAFLFAALAQNMGEDRATHAATTQYPAADQKPQDPAMIFVFALIFIVVVAFILVLVFRLAMLAHEVRKKEAADPAATQQPARNQELQDAMLLVPSLLAFLTRLLAFFVATAFAHQMCEKQAPHTPTAQAAADCQFLEF